MADTTDLKSVGSNAAAGSSPASGTLIIKDLQRFCKPFFLSTVSVCLCFFLYNNLKNSAFGLAFIAVTPLFSPYLDVSASPLSKLGKMPFSGFFIAA